MASDRPESPRNRSRRSFPAIHPLSAYPNQVSLHDIDLSAVSSDPSDLAPPDTAVIAELDTVLTSSGSSLICTLKDSAAHLCIHNAAIEIEKDSLTKLYPRASIAIKSAQIIKHTSGETSVKSKPLLVISVACPAAVEFLGLAQEDRIMPLIAKEDRSVVFRAIGDSMVEKEQYVHAGLYFAAAAEEAKASKQPEDNLIRAYTEHIRCCIQLRRFQDVLWLSEKVLCMNGYLSIVKALYYRGLALMNLECHAEAVVCMNRALDLCTGVEVPELARERILKAMTNAAQRRHQQERGEYNVADFFVNGLGAKDAPEKCSDYVSGALEIRMTGDGRGRGIFVSKDVKVGELLMVSNPLFCPAFTAEQLPVEAINACCYSRLVRKALEFLPDSESMENLPLPSIQDFRYDHASSKDDGGVIDVERIERVVELASRHSFKLRYPETEHVARKQVYALPALINHSCLSNSTMLAVGEAVFVRAAKPVQAGEEITVGYVDCLKPLAVRSRMLRKCWKFDCFCDRCKVEKRHEHVFRNVPEMFVDSNLNFVLDNLLDVEVKFRKALAKLPTIVSDEQRDMIQAGYLVPRLLLLGSLDHLDSLQLKIKTMDLMQKWLPADCSTIMLVAREILQYVCKLEWDDSFERLLGDAMAALMGNDVNLPSGDYISICANLNKSRRFVELFGF